MPIRCYVFNILENLFYVTRFFYRYVRYTPSVTKKIVSCEDNRNKTVRVFVTGPSLNNEIEDLRSRGVDLHDSVVVNFFADTELFQIIKPKYYAIVDPAFFNEDHKEMLESKILRYINKIEWDMQLIVPDCGYKYIKDKVTNTNISISTITTSQFEGYEKLRFSLYRKGMAAPSFVNVSIYAIFSMLSAGYKNIELYGADHDYFLKGLCVDDDNYFYLERSHFYGNELQRIERYTSDGKRWKVSNLMWENYLTFKVHEEMNRYASYLGARIINCTRRSLIDAYTRITQIEKQKEMK